MAAESGIVRDLFAALGTKHDGTPLRKSISMLWIHFIIINGKMMQMHIVFRTAIMPVLGFRTWLFVHIGGCAAFSANPTSIRVPPHELRKWIGRSARIRKGM